MEKVLKDIHIELQLRILMLKCYVRVTMLYGCET